MAYGVGRVHVLLCLQEKDEKVVDIQYISTVSDPLRVSWDASTLVAGRVLVLFLVVQSRWLLVNVVTDAGTTNSVLQANFFVYLTHSLGISSGDAHRAEDDVHFFKREALGPTNTWVEWLASVSSLQMVVSSSRETSQAREKMPQAHKR